EEINIAQAGFRRGRGTREQILNMRIIIEKCREYNIDLFACFIDYSKAFDCVQNQMLWNIMTEMRFPSHLIHLIKMLYKEQQAAVQIESGKSDWFGIGQRVQPPVWIPGPCKGEQRIGPLCPSMHVVRG